MHMSDEWKAPVDESKDDRSSWKLLERPCLRAFRSSGVLGAGEYSSSF
jgi:hypothetical protein